MKVDRSTPTRNSGSSWLWSATAVLMAAVILTPVATILYFVFAPSEGNFQHLVDTVLPIYVRNSLLLMAGVAVGTSLMGVSTAWLATLFDFPGRRFFEWAQLLPLAMPAYIIAYSYTGLLEFAGPVQSGLRESMGWSREDYWFPPVRSLGGAVTMLSLVLYPYVFLLARAAFINQSVCMLEASRTLGCAGWRAFFRVALPLARPAIIAGLALVMMETLADFGTVEYFGVQTFTTGIFRTWFGLYDTAGAARLAGVLLVFVLTLLALERASRRQAKYHFTTERVQPLKPARLKGWRGWVAMLVCLLPVLFGFAVPALQLGGLALDNWAQSLDDDFFKLVGNSVTLALIASVVILVPAMTLALAQRNSKSKFVKLLIRLCASGYAIPGTVVAIGVLIPLGAFDNAVDLWAEETFGIRTGLLLSGSLFALVFAYAVRFLTAALNTVESGLQKIKPSVDEAARTLGCSEGQVLRRIYLPVVRGSVLTAVLIVFVDVLKELPATLVLRPFNFNTLAVRTYELASDERLAEAALPALTIVACGLIPVVILSQAIRRSRPGANST